MVKKSLKYYLCIIFILCSYVLYAKTQVTIECDTMNSTYLDSELYITYLNGNIKVTSNDYIITSNNCIINHFTNIAQFTDNVKIEHQNYSSICDEASIDYKNNIAELNQNVKIISKGYSINANKSILDNNTKLVNIEGNIHSNNQEFDMTSNFIQLNLKTEEMSSIDSNLILNPKISKGYLDEKLYIKVKELHKGNTYLKYKLFDCLITGCDLENPHYHLFANEMDIVTDKRIVLNHVKLLYHNRILMNLPKLVIPLDARYNDERVIPKFGLSTQNGYYIKLFYPYNPKSKDFYGRMIFDITTKKGIGLGINQEYKFNNLQKGIIEGDFSYYKQFRLNNKLGNEEFNLNHQHNFGKYKFNFRLDGNTNIYENQEDYKYLSYNGTINYTSGYFKTDFGYSKSISTSYYKSENESYSFSHSGRITKNYDYLFNLNVNNYYAESYNTSKLSTSAYFKGKETYLDWKIFTQLFTDLGDEKNASLGTEKKPEITLSSDFARLNLINSKDFNIKFNSSFSKLSLTNGEKINRTYLDLYVPTYTVKLNNFFDFEIDGRYKQYYYKSDMAKYALASSSAIKYKINTNNTFSLDYNFQNPKGYSPVSSDNLSSYQYSNFKWIYDNNKNLNMELFTGYNFKQKSAPWENLYYKIKWKANNNFSSYLSTYYDLNEKKWGVLIGQLKYSNKNNAVEIGARYNVENAKLTSAKALLNINLIGDYYLNAFTNYDGNTKKFDYIAAEIQRKHHCYDTSLVYKRQTGYYQDTSIMLYVKLNLFPDTNEFQSGPNGQAITSDVGNLYY